jgi:DNA modification methylase
LLCADAREQSAYETLLGGEKIGVVITDAPYNVKVHGHASGLGERRHREFPMASGEMSQDEFISFLKCCFGNMARCSQDGALHYVFMDWRHVWEALTAGKDIFSKLLNICVWCKTNAGMGSFYRSQHEFVLVFRNGPAAHINNIELGKYGRSRSNVWTYAGVNTFKRGREEELDMHPTVKPVDLVADAIKDASSYGSNILDPFLGSGTILIAAEKTGRRAFGMELDPLYVDVAIRRWQTYSGKSAVHTATGMTFEQMEDQSTAKQVGA